MEILELSFTAFPILVVILCRTCSMAQTTDDTPKSQDFSNPSPYDNNNNANASADANVDDTGNERNYERKSKPNTTELPTTTECPSCLECYNCHLSIECAKTVGMTVEKCNFGIPCSSMEREYAGYLYMARGCADKTRPPRCQNETLDGHRFLVCDCDTDLCNLGHCHFHSYVFAILLFGLWSFQRFFV